MCNNKLQLRFLTLHPLFKKLVNPNKMYNCHCFSGSLTSPGPENSFTTLGAMSPLIKSRKLFHGMCSIFLYRNSLISPNVKTGYTRNGILMTYISSYSHILNIFKSKLDWIQKVIINTTNVSLMFYQTVKTL